MRIFTGMLNLVPQENQLMKNVFRIYPCMHNALLNIGIGERTQIKAHPLYLQLAHSLHISPLIISPFALRNIPLIIVVKVKSKYPSE